MKEMFVGLDIHAEEFYGTILDRHDEVLSHDGLPNRKETIQSFFVGISGSKLIVTIEACGIGRKTKRCQEDADEGGTFNYIIVLQ